MLNLILATFTGVVGAAVLHILIILVLPYNTGSDVWSKIQAIGKPFEFFVLSNQKNSTGLHNDDIHIQTAVCEFDLENAPLQIISDDATNLWTFSVFDTGANEIFSMSARSAIKGEVNFLVLTRAQTLALRTEDPELLNETISIEMNGTEGYAVLRSIAPNASEI